MTYAIISDSGQQFRVEPGQGLQIDLRNVHSGEVITFDKVLAVSNENGLRIGQPIVTGAHVTAEVVGIEQGDKLVVQKFRRRKNSRRRTGHRQKFTKVVVKEILG
jgi:large subunit ribosomal protein L21